MPQLLECVPNFSEGRDPEVIRQITAAIEAVGGVTLLNVDPGKATNRTVVTFVGEPEPVVEAAFRGIAKAAELIDMSRHTGEHPRMGATDVCPLVPIAGITMEEAARWSEKLAGRVGRELAIPVYLYEAAQPDTSRKDLSVIRAGEYEALPKKLADPKWKPDFGPAKFNPKTGATVIGARKLLVAFNVNLNTTSTRWANAVAFDVREAGRPKRTGDPLTGPIATDAAGNPVNIPGTLKSVKAIGWFIEEYGIAQVSMNLTDLAVTPLHVAFDEVCRKGEARGLRVTGSELVGMIPLEPMLEAGRHFLRKQRRSLGVSERELIRLAVVSMGLDELAPFHSDERIIEYRLRDASAATLAGMTLAAFADETAAESPAPGGGSVSAYVGALGAALATMVANLSAHKRGWDGRWEEFSTSAERGGRHKQALLDLVDEDTRAFNRVLAAMGLPKTSEGEKKVRTDAMQAATRGAMEVPLHVMEEALASMDVCRAMAEQGNPASVSDAGVGALCARAAILGAGLNVRINAPGLKDRVAVDAMLKRADEIERTAMAQEAEILRIVRGRMNG